MIEKLYKKVKNIQDFNETASKLRQMGLKDELKNLAGKYKVPEVDLKEFLSGKRYFLIDGGETQKDYMSARSKLLDEMFNLNDPQFTDVIGNYLIKCCDKSDFADLVLQKHKTLQRCVESIMSRAYEMVSDEVKKSGRYANMAVLEDTVFKWAEEAFHKRLSVQINTPKGNKNKTTKKRNASKKNKAGGANSNASEREGKHSSAKTEAADQNKDQIEGQVSLFENGLAE